MKKVSNTNWEQLATMEDKDIDTSDIPDLTETFFRDAELRTPLKQSLDSDMLSSAEESLKVALQEALSGNTHPIETLWVDTE